MSSPVPGTVRLADYAPPPYRVDTVDLEFDLDAARTVVKSRMRVRRAPDVSKDTPLHLDGVRLE